MMEKEIVLYPARHDERSREVRLSKNLWNAVLRAVQKSGGTPFEERFDPTNARRFAQQLRLGLERAVNKTDRPAVARHNVFMPDSPAKAEPLAQESNQAVIEAVLRLFEAGSGVVVAQALPKATRAI